MRTKTLLLTAALTAAGASVSMAQTIYSVNAVGYVNITLPVGDHNGDGNPDLALIANPLDGTNNTLNTILPLPIAADGTAVFVYDAGAKNYASTTFIGDPDAPQWLPNLDVPPGVGFFIQAYNSAGPAIGTLQVTFVGEVRQGTLNTTLPGPSGVALLSSIAPQSLPLGNSTQPNTLNFPSRDADTVFLWDEVNQTYVTYTYVGGEDNVWLPNNPLIEVARSFFIVRPDLATNPEIPPAEVWTRTFSVN